MGHTRALILAARGTATPTESAVSSSGAKRRRAPGNTLGVRQMGRTAFLPALVPLRGLSTPFAVYPKV
jgi:hypothetical protein